MPAVLILGIAPAHAPGVDAAALHGALEAERGRLAADAIEAEMCLLDLDGTPEATVDDVLAQRAWDVVVIGGGIRKPEPLLKFFEYVVNSVRRLAPQAAIAFNSSGGDSAEAARRWLRST